MKVKECADIMGISVTKLRSAIRHGFYDWGKCIRRDTRDTFIIDKPSFYKWLEERRLEDEN